jgi:autotransporter-associated beta strand protein
LSATNSTYGITSVNAGVLSIASTPNAGAIVNNAEIQPASAASVLTIPNAISGTGHFFFTGFQTTVLTGVSSFTGVNTVFWSDVIVDNAQALGDTTTGKTVISGADRFGGLYLSNNITWSQPMQLDTRYTTGAAATAPHVANVSGTNTVTSALTFATGSAAGVNGTNVNVEVTAGQLTIDATSTLANNANSNPNILNLQGAGTGIWNGVLANSSQPLSVTMRGTGTWTLGGTNTYTGNTTISAGTLALSGNGQITNSTKIILAGGTTLDVSAMNSPFALGSSQTLSNSTSTAVLAGNAGTGSGTVSLTFASGTPALSETNGTLTLSSSTTFKVNNTGSTLALGSYKIIATNTGGFVAGTLPTPTVSGAGALAGHPVVLSIVNSELYLVVTNTAPTANFLSMGAVSGLPVTLKIIGGKHAPVDPDGDAVTVTAVGAAGNGTTSTDGTNVTYTASGSFTGSDSFTYTVTDTYGATATASVTVTVVASGEGFNKVSGPTALGGGDFRLTFLGVPGYSYALDWTGSLTPPVTWTPQLTNAADTNGFLIFTNNQVGSPNFWRTRNVP